MDKQNSYLIISETANRNGKYKNQIPLIPIGWALTESGFKAFGYEDRHIQKCLENGKIRIEPDLTGIDEVESIDRIKKIIAEKEDKQHIRDYKEILADPKLWDRIIKEFSKKIEGEEHAVKAIFLTFNMRNVFNINKASDNLMVNDIGGTGKDYLVSSIYQMMPEKEKVSKNRISAKALGYLNDIKKNPEGWVKKCLYLEDVPNNVLNDDCFKVMCSADPNGISESSIVANNALKDITIKGKPSIVITIASGKPKQELLRRFPIVNLTGSIEQTKAVMRKQALFAMKGISPDYNPDIKKALSYLNRIKVKVDYANLIAEVFPHGNTIVRTHFPRFIDYIRSSCSLYQFQRKKDDEGFYLATEQDYNIAREVLASTTSNQLMIPLTKIQKEILEVFSKVDKKGYEISEIYTLLTNLGGESWIRKQINKLVEYGFIKRRNESRDHSFKPVAVYQYADVHKLELPDFEKLKETQKCPNKENKKNKKNSLNNPNTLHNKKTGRYLDNLEYLDRDSKYRKMDNSENDIIKLNQNAKDWILIKTKKEKNIEHLKTEFEKTGLYNSIEFDKLISEMLLHGELINIRAGFVRLLE